jgi:hypothetical protein
MKTQKLGKAYLAFTMAVFFAMGAVSFAAQTSRNETGTKDVKEKVSETAQAIEKYFVDQRDEAVRKAKAALDDLDAHIDSLESRLNKKWEMDQFTRKKARAALRTLREERNEVAEWYAARSIAPASKSTFRGALQRPGFAAAFVEHRLECGTFATGRSR